MRKAGNRLVLGLLAAALLAGLFTSVFVRPQSALTAAEECYGSCRPTVTELFLSTDIAIYGHEQFVHFDVVVRSSNGSGTPTGQVVVRSGKTLCTIHLHSGMGMCSPHARALKPGFHTVVAHYNGGHGFKSSTSNEAFLFVLRHPWFDGFGGQGAFR